MIPLRCLSSLLLAAWAVTSAPSAQSTMEMEIDGATIEFAWPITGGGFLELTSLHFRSTLELDGLALYDDKAVLIYHPGRFQLTYELSSGVSALAATPLMDGSGTDGALVSTQDGLALVAWGTAGGTFFETTPLAAGAWSSVVGLWAFPWGTGVRVHGYDPVGQQLLRGTFDGTSLTPLAPLPAPQAVRDLASIEWSAASEGLELARRVDDALEVLQADGTPITSFALTAVDHFGVGRSGPLGDVLMWISTATGFPTLHAQGESASYVPFLLDPGGYSDLVVHDRDGDGVDDVVLSRTADATARVLRRGGGTFGPFPDGGTLVLTGTSGEVRQTDPIRIGTSGDFDNDGTADLLFAQESSSFSQYIGRPDWEERYRFALSGEGGPVVGGTGGTRTLSFLLNNPYYELGTHVWVQALALDWSTGTIDPIPLDASFQPFVHGSQTTTITVSYDLSEVPEEHVLYVSVAQVTMLGTQILRLMPTRHLYYSPLAWIEAILASAAYPPDTDPLNNGIGTGGRLGSRIGSGGAGSGPPP